MLRILIADDHALVRRGIRELLQDAAEEAELGEARNSFEVLEKTRTEHWDLVLLDLFMAGLGSLQALTHIRNSSPATRVLVLSFQCDPQTAIGCLKAGVAGYLCKDAIADELLVAIERVMAGQVYVGQALSLQPNPFVKTGQLYP